MRLALHLDVYKRQEWMHADCLADYYHVEVFSEEHWKLLENYFQEYVKRDCNMMLTPLFLSLIHIFG